MLPVSPPSKDDRFMRREEENAILLFTATDHLTIHEDDQEYWQRGEYHVNVIISVFFISCHNLLKCCQQQPVKLAAEL